MTFTTSFLSSLNRPKLFEEFLSVLDKNKISISQNLDEFNKLNNLRNDFAHSYFVPKKPNMKNGFCVTKIYSKSEMSSIEGFTKNNSDEEYLIKYSNLEKLTGEVYEIMSLNFKND